jgi:amino acid permease
MMAIAGAIGTGKLPTPRGDSWERGETRNNNGLTHCLLGLILGSGTALRNGGPGGLLIGYLLMGFVVYVVMVALGEMGAWLPHKKSFSGYASRFVDPAMGLVFVPSSCFVCDCPIPPPPPSTCCTIG